ncbi:MAG TPA: PEGA domain-containing protein [Gallionella sp.]|nr:PEGA domain-containing protein [Gallionella sp.]
MNPVSRRIVLSALLFTMAGCSSVSSSVDSVKNSVSGLFGGSSDSSVLDTTGDKRSARAANTGPAVKYGATLRVSKYVDQRKIANPKQLGEITVRVMGISGHELTLDQDVATIATSAIKKRFDSEGFLVMEGGNASNALFEVSGVVKELTLNVKERDDVSIAIETTVKELATGKVVWSGLVTEKNDRFAGVAGNDKSDIVAYLNSELRVVSSKTVDAISASLMASRPELFNLTPGTKPIKGVTVYVAPSAAAPAAPVAVPVPAYGTPANAAVPAPAYAPHASATAGLLLVNTDPQRAKVYLDGVYYGMSPLRLEMEPGVHAIGVKLEGYKMVTEKVSVRKGDNTEIELKLER